MTTPHAQQWNNSQGARIPKNLHEQMDNMTDGYQIDAGVQDCGITFKPIHDAMRVIQVPRLSNVFKDHTTEYQAEEDPFGASRGDELL